MISRLRTLQDQRAELVRTAKAQLAKAYPVDGSPPVQSEIEAYLALEAKLAENAKALEAEQRMASIEANLSPVHDPQRTAALATIPADSPHAGPDAKKWSGFGEMLQAVRRAGSPGGSLDPRLMAYGSGASETVPSDGGFLIQPEFSSQLLKRTYELGQISSRITRLPIGPNANGLKINAVDETSRVTGSRYGGVQAFWTDEGGVMTGAKPKLRQLELYLRKLTGLMYATDELLQDTTALEALAQQAFPEEFNFLVEDAVINGTGAGMPLGFLNSGCVVVQTKEGGQSATTVVTNNILKMFGRLWARSRQNAVWLINQDVEQQLYGLTLGNYPVYMPPGGLSAAPFGTMLGRPVIPVEYCATLGTSGDIIFVDLSSYLAIDKGGIQSASSIHVRFIYDETTFRFVYRVDGQPTWNAPLTPYKGSNTLSPCVVVENR